MWFLAIISTNEMQLKTRKETHTESAQVEVFLDASVRVPDPDLPPAIVPANQHSDQNLPDHQAKTFRVVACLHGFTGEW